MTDEELQKIKDRFRNVWPLGLLGDGWTLTSEPEYDAQDLEPIGNVRTAISVSMKYIDIELRLSDGSPVLTVEHAKNFTVGMPGLEFLMQAPRDVHYLINKIEELEQEIEEKNTYIYELEIGSEDI